MTDFVGVTPVGRLISEAIWQMTDSGYQGKKLDNPQHYIQIAIPKTDPALPELFANMTGSAQAGFFNNEPNRPDFAWKFKDGDQSPDREGWPGCFVFTFRTGFPLSAIVDVKNQQILDRNLIKPGYQVRVAYSVKANGDSSKPGVYLNFNMVQLISVDKEIQTGPAPATVFATPVAPRPMQPGALAAAPGQNYAPQAPAAPAVPGQNYAPQAPAAPAVPGRFAGPAQNYMGAPQPDPSFLNPVDDIPY